MKQFIKKFIGEFILIGGVGLFVCGVFNFSYMGRNFVVYYYDYGELLMITIGAILVTFGVLIIRNKNTRNFLIK